MREPSDLAYRAALLDVARSTQRMIREALEHFLHSRHDALRSDENELEALFRRLRVQSEKITAARTLPIAKRFVVASELENRANMNLQFRSVLTIDPFRSNRGLARTMRKRLGENIDLIESIPAELLTEVESVVQPAVASGLRVEELMQQVAERFSVSDSRAQLIARDQVGKYNADLTRERQESAGINTYTWSTSKDQRVRHDHAALEGHTYSYGNPPIVDVRTGRRANPGEDYQCRCQALANVSDVLDALGVSGDEDVIVESDV